MDDRELKEILAELEHWEGRVSYMYRDGAPTPNVTIGVGCLLKTVGQASDLPFMVASTVVRKATSAQVAADFHRVRGLPGGRHPHDYQARPPQPVLYLDDEDITKLALQRLRDAVDVLVRLIPGFLGFPRPAMVALLDLAWNLGTGPYPGLAGWDKLLAACAYRDWSTCSKECHVASSRETRNEWRRQLFLSCVGLA